MTKVRLRPIRSPKCPNRIPPTGRAINPNANVPNERINPIVGVDSGKNAAGKIKAAAVAYKKKSYHSILVPANAVSATLRILCFKCVSSAGASLGVIVSDMDPPLPVSTIIVLRCPKHSKNWFEPSSI